MHEPSTPIDSIVDLTQRLVRIPSRAGVDSYEPILTLTRQWLEAARVACEPLLAAGRLVGLHGVVRGGSPGPVYMLDATLDTAGFGDDTHWRDAPTSGVIRNGRLHGRGAADSKAGAALFCHLLAAFARRADSFSGTLVLLLDLDEHTGGFAGVRTYFAREASLPRPQGVFIGYPGNERIVVGGRGFLRASLVVRGESAHSGSSRPCGINAIVRAAALSQQLAALALPAEADSRFPLPPKLTVTAIEGGQGDSLVPDRCSLRIDVRLTPRFDDHAAREAVSSLVATFDAQAPQVGATAIAWEPGWPAYRIDEGAAILQALSRAARRAFGRDIPASVAGPSNIGNYLATLGVPAISGFGVSCEGIHASNESIELATIEPVYRAYHEALEELLRAQ